MKKSVVFACLCLCFVGFVFAQSAEKEDIKYIKAGRLFDSEKGRVLSDHIIKVVNNTIFEVGATIPIPENASVIDLSSYTVLPGLIDGHTHLLHLETVTDKHPIANEILFQGDALRALRGAKRAKSFLENGFTTVRDLGNSGQFLDVALKQAITEGTVVGPRMFVSGPIISSEGGQVVGILKQHHQITSNEYRIIKNVDEAINAVRENVNYGADIIKICANNTPNNTSLTIDEMRAIVKMANRYNKKVTAHATSNIAVWEATTAGVDAIEHGYAIADSTLTLMAKKGTALVPTDISKKLLYKYFELLDFKGDLEKAVISYQSRKRDRLQRAIKAGVTILTGSDNYMDFEIPQGEAAKNILVAYQEEGMEPLEILRSSTYLSSKFMNMSNRIGVIKKGAFADIIAVRGDLEKNFSDTIFNVVFVMKDGKVYIKE